MEIFKLADKEQQFEFGTYFENKHTSELLPGGFSQDNTPSVGNTVSSLSVWLGFGKEIRLNFSMPGPHLGNFLEDQASCSNRLMHLLCRGENMVQLGPDLNLRLRLKDEVVFSSPSSGFGLAALALARWLVHCQRAVQTESLWSSWVKLNVGFITAKVRDKHEAPLLGINPTGTALLPLKDASEPELIQLKATWRCFSRYGVSQRTPGQLWMLNCELPNLSGCDPQNTNRATLPQLNKWSLKWILLNNVDLYSLLWNRPLFVTLCSLRAKAHQVQCFFFFKLWKRSGAPPRDPTPTPTLRTTKLNSVRWAAAVRVWHQCSRLSLSISSVLSLLWSRTSRRETVSVWAEQKSYAALLLWKDVF